MHARAPCLLVHHIHASFAMPVCMHCVHLGNSFEMHTCKGSSLDLQFTQVLRSLHNPWSNKPKTGLSSLLPPLAFSASPTHHRLTYLGEAVWGRKWRPEADSWHRPEGQSQDSLVSCGTQHTMSDEVFTLTLWLPRASLLGLLPVSQIHYSFLALLT